MFLEEVMYLKKLKTEVFVKTMQGYFKEGLISCVTPSNNLLTFFSSKVGWRN